MKRITRLALFAFFIFTAFATLAFANDTVERRPKIGLVLSGGGAKGIAHIGVLKVLEELGIVPDYITGTSMGAVIGSLYAVGYSADEIEAIALEQNWTELLSDTLSRRNISLEEKDEHEIYLLSLPFKNWRMELPKGLIAGQNLSMMLARYLLPAHSINDFTKLPIPFKCMGTDLVNGKPVVLDRGYLPDAIRASMSIPSALIPIEIDGHLLVDGGITRNIPVGEIKAMGADIVIAVDVGAPLYKKEQLNSLVRVMNQITIFRGVESNEEQAKKADILITPDIENYDSMSFGRIPELLKNGEIAAGKQYESLKTLKEKITGETRERKESLVLPDELKIKKIQIVGLKNVSENLVLGKLKIKVPGRLTLLELEQSVNRLYASGYFERVTYRLYQEEEGDLLVLNVYEGASNHIRVGGHYDSEQQSSIYLNTVFRNIWGEGSKLNLTAKLGKNYALYGKYGKYSDIGGSLLGVEAEIFHEYFDIFTYVDGRRVESYKFNPSGIQLLAKSILFHDYSVSFGAMGEDITITPEISQNFDDEYKIWYLRLFTALERDTLERLNYPRNGGLFHIQFASSREAIPNRERDFKTVNLEAYRAFPLATKVTLFGGLYSGLNLDSDTDAFYRFFLGGLAKQHRAEFFPFAGADFMEISARNVAVLSMGFQYEVMDDKFLIFRGDIANATADLEKLTKSETLMDGQALTFGMKTAFGPVEFSLTRGSKNEKLKLFVSLGNSF